MNLLLVIISYGFTAVAGLALLVGVGRLCYNAAHRRPRPAYSGWALLQIALTFAGGVVLLYAHGRPGKLLPLLLLAVPAAGLPRSFALARAERARRAREGR